VNERAVPSNRRDWSGLLAGEVTARRICDGSHMRVREAAKPALAVLQAALHPFAGVQKQRTMQACLLSSTVYRLLTTVYSF
jgi:hypothetical protein